MAIRTRTAAHATLDAPFTSSSNGGGAETASRPALPALSPRAPTDTPSPNRNHNSGARTTPSPMAGCVLAACALATCALAACALAARVLAARELADRLALRVS